MGLSPEQVAALPPPLVKIRDLEQENARLHRENEELRRLLAETGGRGHHNTLDLGRRDPLSAFHDTRNCDRDFKRRKMNGIEELYIVRAANLSMMTALDVPPLCRIPAIRRHIPVTFSPDHLRSPSLNQLRIVTAIFPP